MPNSSEARSAGVRALVQSAVVASVVVFATGGAYWAGGLARADVVHARAAVQGRSPAAGPYTLASVGRLALDVSVPSAPPLLIKTAYAPAPLPAVKLRPAADESRDLECLGQAIYYEARGESAEGQAAVAQVVLNRVRHKAYPKTVCGVVFQHSGASCQFSFACHGTGKPPVESAAWRRSKAVAARMLAGEVMVEVGLATAFHAGHGDNVSGLLKVAQVGAHAFYKFAGRAGAAPMFRDALPSTVERQHAFASTDAGRLFTAGALAVHHAVDQAAAPFRPEVSPHGVRLAANDQDRPTTSTPPAAVANSPAAPTPKADETTKAATSQI